MTFRNINRLFVLSFKNGNNDPTINSFYNYYIPLAEIKDFNALIDNIPFVDLPVKSKQNVYENLIEMSKNDEYTAGNFLDFSFHQNYYKVIDIDLSRQTKLYISQQINFTGIFEEDDGAVMFVIAEKQQKNYYKH